jgi:hypothetical protein
MQEEPRPFDVKFGHRRKELCKETISAKVHYFQLSFTVFDRQQYTKPKPRQKLLSRGVWETGSYERTKKTKLNTKSDSDSVVTSALTPNCWTTALSVGENEDDAKEAPIVVDPSSAVTPIFVLTVQFIGF